VLLGHNLDESVDFAGFISVNKRETYKGGTTWQDFKDCNKPLQPTLGWVSRYGSITWSSQGRDLPDGGINEAGLGIEEMSLSGYPYPIGGIRPRLFQMQWIQYHLDQFSTVEEVIRSATSVLPDGWPWHFLIVDKQGHCATLEYIRNRLVVHSGDTLPVTALCNSPYAEELTGLKRYRGFGGRRKVDPNNKEKYSRFVRAACFLRDYDPKRHGSPVDYVLAILENLGGSMTRRSYVVDLKNETVHFRTGTRPQIRHFTYTDFDFSSNTPVRTLDFNTSDVGDVTGAFRDYTAESNWRIARSWVDHVRQIYPGATETDSRNGGWSLAHVERYANYPRSSLSGSDLGSAENALRLPPLVWAAYRGDAEAVQKLLHSEMNPNVRTHVGVTPLIAAAQTGSREVTQLLIRHGAELDAADRSGNSALIVALVFGHSNIARDLIAQQAKVQQGNRLGLSPLFYAAGSGDFDVVKLLLEKGAEVNARSATGYTVLMSATEAGSGCADTIQHLLARGADVNAQDDHGNSALLGSVWWGNTEAAELLIEAGANVQTENDEGMSPWKASVTLKDHEMQQLLKQAGAKPGFFRRLF
jgi:choloylglycine hydrolase